MKLRDTLGRILEKYDLPLYLFLFLAAMFLRLSAIDAPPLSGKEAAEAWGALHLLRGEAASSGSALFSSLTAGVLFIAGPSHWAPRFLPSLAGALAVFLPMLLRRERGRLESFLAALLIALSPSLGIASTTAGGTAVGFLAAGFCILYLRGKEKHPLTGGIALGLATASGPAGWSGLAIAGIVLLLDRILRGRTIPAAEKKPADPFQILFGQSSQPLIGPAGFLFGLLAGSTGLFFFPRGLAALAAGVTSWVGAFLSGWPRVGEFLLLLVAYEPVALVFGAAGIILIGRGLLSEEDRFWGVFAGIAVLWVLLRPAAFPEDALWVVLPLLILGARVLRSAVESSILEQRPVFVALHSGAVLILAVFAGFNLAAYDALHRLVDPDAWVYLLLAVLGTLAALLVGPLFAEDWRRGGRDSLVGLALAGFVLFSAAQFGAGWNAVHGRRTSANELWRWETVPADIVRLHKTLEQISEWQTGVADELTVMIEWPEESALGWELLTYGAAEYVTAVDMPADPAMLITPYGEQEGVVVTPKLTAAYSGQSFAVTERRAWSGWPPDIIGWLLHRDGPVERGHMILWVRTDILVGETEAAP